MRNLVIEADDSNSPAAGWLRDLYESQSLCEICGKPFFALNERSTICGNTCAQQRRRCTHRPGYWFHAATLKTEVDHKVYPRTISELLRHPQLEAFKENLRWPILGVINGDGTVAVIDTDDTPKPKTVQPKKPQPAAAPPKQKKAKPAVIDADDNELTKGEIKLGEMLMAGVQQLIADGEPKVVAKAFQGNTIGLGRYDLAVKVFGRKKPGSRPMASEAGRKLGLDPTVFRNRRNRIVAAINGEKLS